MGVTIKNIEDIARACVVLLNTGLLIQCNCNILVWCKCNGQHIWSAQIDTDVHASQLQLFQTYLLVRCNYDRHACWSSAIVTDVPGGRVQL